MRVTLTSGAFVEGVVTLAAALLMTFAAFEMVHTGQVSNAHATASATQLHIGVAVPRTVTATAHPAQHCLVNLPHVDELRG